MNDTKTPWNPSRSATKRVTNPLPVPTSCECGRSVEVAHHDDVYGRSYGQWPWVYLCCCGRYVGMHPFTNIPLGTLADAATRQARKVCKAPFEALYKSGRMSRGDAYELLASKLGIDKNECHFGWFDIERCEKASTAAREIFRASRGDLYRVQ